MRRRLRRQQRVREALLLDLGALVYELHRQGRREPELLQQKAAELSAVDREVRALAQALDEGQALTQLVAAGIAGSCDACGSLLTSDARFCSQCGAPTGLALGGEQAPSQEVPPGIATGGNGAGRAEDDVPELETGEHPAVELDEDGAETEAVEPEVEEAEPEPEELEPEPEPEAVEEPAAEETMVADVPEFEQPEEAGEPEPEPRAPGPPPPPPIGEPVADRAVRAVRVGLRRGRRWLRDRAQR